MSKSINNETLCVHAGTYRDPVTGGVNTPIFTSSANNYIGSEKQFYPRYFNTPNQQSVIEKVCALEKAEGGVLFGSGMAAISTTLLALLAPEDHAVIQAEVYGGTYSLIEKHFIGQGFDCTLVATDADAVIAAVTEKTRLIYIESPTNPLLSVIDIAKVADFARDNNIITVIDNTFASPVLQNPTTLGIDVVIHSGTKYLSGHSDLSCGIAVTSQPLAEKIQAAAKLYGGCLNAQDCYLLERSLKTLSLRVERQSQNAQTVAEMLNAHEAIESVYYSGLEDNSGHSIAKSQMTMFGSMLSFELKSQSAQDFLSRLKLIQSTLSLGGVESIICVPAETSHLYLTDAERESIGISPRLLRLSVGIEHVDDIITDIKRALA